MKGSRHGFYRLMPVGLLMLALLSGCRLDGDDPLQQQPASVSKGYVIAGETGDRVVSVLLAPITIDGTNAPPGDQCSIRLYPGPDMELIAQCVRSVHDLSAFESCYLGGAIEEVQIAGFMLIDSLVECWDISADSLTGTVTRYNTSMPVGCDGQLYFVEELHTPIAQVFDYGARIDDDRAWANGGYLLKNSTNYGPQNANGPRLRQFLYYQQWNTTSPYMGLRFRTPQGFRYGYARIAWNQSTLTILDVVIER